MTEVARRQRIRAETVVQEVRLRNFDDVLMDLRELFNQIGIVQEGTYWLNSSWQYSLAKRNNKCSWLYEARRMAVLCLPENCVDTHLCRWNWGKPLISGRRKTKPTSTVQSTPGMAKDRRVMVEGKDLPSDRCCFDKPNGLLWIFYVFVLSCVCYVLCASVYMCFVVTCWERADLLALVCAVFCEFVTFPLVSWVRCGT